MRSLNILSIIPLFFIFACSKEKVEISTANLTGRWIITESLADIGDGKGDWKAVSKNNLTYVEFKADGGLAGSAFPSYVSYAIKDSTTVTFKDKDQVIQNYAIQLKDRKLTMRPAGPIFCMEACGTRFEKIK